jgi:hypothetical protein
MAKEIQNIIILIRKIGIEQKKLVFVEKINGNEFFIVQECMWSRLRRLERLED